MARCSSYEAIVIMKLTPCPLINCVAVHSCLGHINTFVVTHALKKYSVLYLDYGN